MGFISTGWWGTASLVFQILAILTIPSILIRRSGRPSSAIAWLLGLAALPPLGVFLWWSIGQDHLKIKRKYRRKSYQEATSRLIRVQAEIPTGPAPDPNLFPIKRLPREESYGVFPPTSGNQASLHVDAQEMYAVMEEAVRRAKHHVHFLFYIWRDDKIGRHFRDLLAQRAREGVEVRVLIDGFGSILTRRCFLRPLIEAGGKASFFLPLKLTPTHWGFNFRNHRKLVVVDGEVGFLGGINIGDEHLANWHDLGTSFRGPVVDQIQEIFVEDWFFSTGEDILNSRYFGRWDTKSGSAPGDASCAVIASGPEARNNAMLDAVFLAVTTAKERIFIITPYFIPDPGILIALRSAVYRGVDVRILVPARPNWPLVHLAASSYYPNLIESGVRIYEFAGPFLHAKALIFDRELSVIGSANMDLRSFRLNFEANCFVGSARLNEELVRLFNSDLKESREITEESLDLRSQWIRAVESAAHLLSPLL